jgi:putative tricarboxylic transport membrane protein
MSARTRTEVERGLSRRVVECAVAALLLFLSALVLWDSYDRGAGWADGPQSGFFPARVGWLMLIASGFAFITGVRRPDTVFVTWEQLRQVARVFVPLVLYVLGIEFLGIYVASALFMVFFMVTLGSFRWWSILLAAILVPLITFWVFEQRFHVPLPKGPVEALLGF